MEYVPFRQLSTRIAGGLNVATSAPDGDSRMYHCERGKGTDKK